MVAKLHKVGKKNLDFSKAGGDGVYQLVEQKGMSYSRAINEMKRIFIRGQTSIDSEPNRGIEVIEADETRPKKLSHPYYWGQFVYYGLN